MPGAEVGLSDHAVDGGRLAVDRDDQRNPQDQRRRRRRQDACSEASPCRELEAARRVACILLDRHRRQRLDHRCGRRGTGYTRAQEERVRSMPLIMPPPPAPGTPSAASGAARALPPVPRASSTPLGVAEEPERLRVADWRRYDPAAPPRRRAGGRGSRTLRAVGRGGVGDRASLRPAIVVVGIVVAALRRKSSPRRRPPRTRRPWIGFFMAATRAPRWRAGRARTCPRGAPCSAGRP